jgi:hypothetical protein
VQRDIGKAGAFVDHGIDADRDLVPDEASFRPAKPDGMAKREPGRLAADNGARYPA